MQVILIMCVASTIALMVNISSTDAISQYEDNDYDDYEETSSYVLIAFINIMLIASLSCTVLALLCDIPVVVAHCITDRVMNSNNAFRIFVCSIASYHSISTLLLFIAHHFNHSSCSHIMQPA